MPSPAESNEYRGYRIDVTPKQDHEDLWDFDYTLTPLDGKGETRRRSDTIRGQMTAEAARTAGIETARAEIDNLLRMQGS
jgi:hypothetical protein